ncbi:MAG TPA: methyltransferase domain-containing protein [Nocardioidaceae bacterium]|nr:methyltransferase domain-containing protein [Nocardioidaceae bacterium]
MDELDQARAEKFAGRLMTMIDNASLALLTSVGHRTGLFDALAGRGPVSSTEAARAAALDERYVREWLGGMVVGGIIEYDPGTHRYTLPPEHAAFMTAAAGPDDLAFFTRYLALMGTIEPEIARVFREGGGVPYSAYPTFQELQRTETARVYDAGLVDAVLPLAPQIVARLEEGIDVVDVGTGAGHAVNVMARAFPHSRFLGVDISEEGTGVGRAEAAEWGLTNARFEVTDAASLTGHFDLITAFDTVHDQAQPTKLLLAIADALADDGVFLMGDIAFSSDLEDNIGNPLAPTVFAFSVFHCLTVSLAYGGEGLGAAWGEQRARAMLAGAGFDDVTAERVEGDPLNIYYVARRTAR